MILGAFVLLLGATWLMFRVVPGGFIPAQDKSTCSRWCSCRTPRRSIGPRQVVRQVSELALQTPGVAHAIGFPGLSANGFANIENAAVMFLPLQDFSERRRKELSNSGIISALSAKLASIPDAYVLIVPPPSVQGLGTTGGFKLYLQDRGGRRLQRARSGSPARYWPRRTHSPSCSGPRLTRASRTPCRSCTRTWTANKAKREGVPLSNIFGTLQTYLGSSYVNDFNLLRPHVPASTRRPKRASARDRRTSPI